MIQYSPGDRVRIDVPISAYDGDVGVLVERDTKVMGKPGWWLVDLGTDGRRYPRKVYHESQFVLAYGDGTGRRNER